MDFHIYLTLLFIFIIRLTKHITVPESLITAIFAPSAYNVQLKEYNELLKQRRELNNEQNLLSAKDHYAKWTKNNRKLDKLNKEISSKGEQLLNMKNTFINNAGKYKVILITLPFFFVKFYFGKRLVYSFNTTDIGTHNNIDKMFPKYFQVLCTVGWFGLPILFIKKFLLEIFGENSTLGMKLAGNNNFLLTSGVSLGIWIWALEKIIDEIEFVVQNLFVKIDKPTIANDKEYTTSAVPSTAELD
ncbi:GET complex subunit GET1 SCDLUD_001480 [Saccharomycodes ludwigii]|uniref:GET complex subunit GET1 n=1 Tax=Saccharomycodes ludwigii TaxID=36035 RepID=UPI001E8A8663|nr:hypothetical protein SCDLUD_001480 [Saccharomycodes ludwigii]KAH3901708.1 hypothetical protein SCDLUD_001480 [Saccharomycodes ludwigii]